jgi:hypothetical protein
VDVWNCWQDEAVAFSLESLIELKCLILLNAQSITKILWMFGIAGEMKGWLK